MPTPPLNGQGVLSYQEVLFRVGVERTRDGARDAFEVRLPIRDDREPVALRQLADLEAGKALAIPALPETARPGSAAAGGASLRPARARPDGGRPRTSCSTYPYGCTEQRVSARAPSSPSRSSAPSLQQRGSTRSCDRAVRQAHRVDPERRGRRGLAAYWPGSTGYVSLTAWVVQFLVEAKDAGFRVDAKLLDGLTRQLEKALRSDYSRFIDGEAFAERCWALAALAQAGKFNAGLRRGARAQGAVPRPRGGRPSVLQSFARNGDVSSATSKELAGRLWDGVVVRLWQGREAYGGLQTTADARNGLILPSETRTVAEVTRALGADGRQGPRVCRCSSTGSSRSAAATAGARPTPTPRRCSRSPSCSSRRSRAARPAPRRCVSATSARPLALGPEGPVGAVLSDKTTAGEVTVDPDGGGPVVVRAETQLRPERRREQGRPRRRPASSSRGSSCGNSAPADRPRRSRSRKPGRRSARRSAKSSRTTSRSSTPPTASTSRSSVPLAAGMEPLNPKLATAPPEAKPSRPLTLAPTYVAVPRRRGVVLLQLAAQGHVRLLLPHAGDDPRALRPAAGPGRADVRRRGPRQRLGREDRGDAQAMTVGA